MKNIILAIVMLFSLAASAQTESKAKKSSIPTAVKQSFAKEFPKQKASWSIEDGGYEAEFKLNGTETSVVYNAKGHRKELEVEIKTRQLPANAVAFVKKNYKNAIIAEAAKITDDRNVVTYEIELHRDRNAFDLLFDTAGKLIRIEKKGK